MTFWDAATSASRSKTCVRNLSGSCRVELTRHRRRPDRHLLQTSLHLSRFRLTNTISDMFLKPRPSAT